MLGEPERTQYDLNFVLFGFPVRVHPLFWLVAVLFGVRSRDPLEVLTWVVAMFLSILVHELGHAVMMRAFGCRPWIVLYGMGGLAAYDPMSPAARRVIRWRHVLVCFAGPLAGFLLAAVIIGVYVLNGGMDFGRQRLTMFLNDMLSICVVWGVINLLPIFPLDGGQIARDVFTMASPARGLRGSLMLSFITAVLVAAAGGVLLRDLFMVVLFGYLAYGSYMMLQAVSGRDPW